jgi:arylsulfatase A-like enzyme
MNILLIIADDLRPQLGAYGHGETQTPHIDALAARSVTFDRAYAQVPACAPSRHSFLTGRSPDHPRNRVFWFEAPKSEDSIFATFTRRGYLTLGCGKLFHRGASSRDSRVHFSPENEPYYPRAYDQTWGCAERACRSSGCTGTAGCAETGRVYVEEESDASGRIFADAQIALAARRRLQLAARSGRRFLLAVGFHHPHFKWRVPRRVWSSYEAEQRIRPAAHPRPSEGVPVFALPDVNIGPIRLLNGTRVPADSYRIQPRGTWAGVPAEAAVEMRRGYASAITFMDEQVQRP